MKTASKQMALCGITAALAVVVMALGGVIPAATYACPLLCMVLLQGVCAACKKRMAWSWYAAVAILSLLMSPDKEAAAVFLSVGYYPICKGWFDRRLLPWLWKLGWFNVVIITLYGVLIRVLGLDQLAGELREFGAWFPAMLLMMGNLIFWMTDRLLSRLSKRGVGHGKGN